MPIATNELIAVSVLLTGVVAGLLAYAPQLSESMVRSRARRLPRSLSSRMGEEWLAELDAMPSRPSQLAFAIALTLTRRHSFAIDEEALFAAPSRPSITVATFGGWRTVVAFTTVLVAGIAYGTSFLIEPLYRSATRILVVPQRISERYVEPTIRISVDDRMQAISQMVLSRKGLARIVLDFDLYPSLRAPESRVDKDPMDGVHEGSESTVHENVVERMRHDIGVEIRTDGQSFDVSYVSPDPRTAMRVADRLASLYIEASLRDREVIADSASQFLNSQIEDVRSRLLKHLTGIRGAKRIEAAEADVRTLELETLESNYRDLLMKKEQSLIAANLERRQIGEQFKLLDPARLPEAPISPNRLVLALLGAAAGFCLGMAMMLGGRSGPFRRPKKALAQS